MNYREQLNYLLQRDVSFVLNDKVYKKGKVLIYAINDFYLYFILKVDNKQNKTFEIPVPFDIRKVGNNILFDYTFDTLSRGNMELYFKLQSITKEKSAKLYNTLLNVIVE